MTHEELEQKHHELHAAHEALKAKHDALHARVEALEQHAHSGHSIQTAEMEAIAHHTVKHLHKLVEQHEAKA